MSAGTIATFREITVRRRRYLIERDPRITGKTCFSLDEFRAWLRGEQVAHDIWKCRYCGVHLVIRDLEIDHWEPLGRGGVTALSNLVPSCKRCNGAKGKVYGSEFVLLIEALKQISQPSREDVLSRLSAGPQWRGRGGGRKSAAQSILDGARERGLFDGVGRAAK